MAFGMEKLLSMLNVDKFTVKVSGYSLNYAEIDKMLTEEGWQKIYDDSSERCCENFTKIYADDSHEVELWYDRDGYLIQITVRRKGGEQE